MADQILELTADELLVLIDRIRNDETGSDEMRCSAYLLLLRLGSAYVDMFGRGEKPSCTLPVAVSEAEAWLLRSKVTSGDKSAGDQLLGVKLLCKLYALLLAFNAPEVAAGTEDGQQMTAADRAALMRRNEPYRRS